jgi:hypothetical protein
MNERANSVTAPTFHFNQSARLPLEFALALFNNDELRGVRLEYAPWPEGETWK